MKKKKMSISECHHEHIVYRPVLYLCYPPIKFGVCSDCLAIIKNTDGKVEVVGRDAEEEDL